MPYTSGERLGVDFMNPANTPGLPYPTQNRLRPNRSASLGLKAVQKVLTNRAAPYGGARYRVSPRIWEQLWSGQKFHAATADEWHVASTTDLHQDRP